MGDRENLKRIETPAESKLQGLENWEGELPRFGKTLRIAIDSEFQPMAGGYADTPPAIWKNSRAASLSHTLEHEDR